MSNTKTLTHLGNQGTTYTYDKPDKDLLEVFENQHIDMSYTVYINSPEFTSLCPKTGQPDFAEIEVWYTPDKLCIESKSWKLYLGSYRQHGEFHEDCVNRMCKDLIELLNPVWIKVKGNFKPRGGIAFVPCVEWHSNEVLSI